MRWARGDSVPTESQCAGNPSGGTSVLVPAGWHVGSRIVLVPGKPVAVVLSDRGCQFYLVSVYLHPDRVKEDLQELTRAWIRLEKVTAKQTRLIALGGNSSFAILLPVMSHLTS